MRLSTMLKRFVRLSHVVWQLVFYLFPLLLLLAIGFWSIERYQLRPGFSTANYRHILSSRLYVNALLTSLWLASTTALLATGFAIPTSHILRFRVRGRMRLLVLFLFFLPFFSSYVIRMFSWQVWLNDSGVIALILKKLALTQAPLGLIYTASAIRIGLLSVLIPIAVLIIFLSLSMMDETLVLAARNLGASSLQIFWRITLPFSLPGLVVAFLFTFIIAFGDFISPSILGGNQVYTLSVIIQDRVKIDDWPTAAALGTMMLGVSATLIAVAFRILRALPVTKGLR